MGLWLGKEKEGKFTDKMTLFIDGDEVTITQIERSIGLHKEIEQLYFGAGKCSRIDKTTLTYFLKNYKKILITAEMPIDDLLFFPPKQFPTLNYIITENNPVFSLINKDNINRFQIKLQDIITKDKVIYVIDFNNAQIVDTTKLEYKRYEDDEVLQ